MHLKKYLKLADAGIKEALRADPSLKSGLNLHDGKVCHRGVSEATGLEYTPVEELI